MSDQQKTKPVRVTILVSKLVVGGAEQLLRDLLEAMDPKVIEPELVFFKEPGPVGEELIAQGFSVTTNVMPKKFDPFAIFRLKRLLQEQNAQVLLLINHLNSLLYGIPAGLLAGVPVVNWHNETFKPYKFHNVTMAARRVVHHGVDTIVAAAKGHKGYIEQHERLPKGKTRVIYNGVAPERVVSKLSPTEARARLGVPENAKVVAQVAALRPDKAHHIMLEAMANVVQRVPEATLLVVGDGVQRQFLEERAKELGLGEHCVFLGVRRDMADVLAASDVMALSSNPQQETLSVAAIEAMFAGKPVVSTRVGFMDEIVLEEKTGLLVPPQSPKPLAEALARLLADDELRVQMGRAAKELVWEQCHTQVMARQFEALFVELASA